MDRVDRLRVVVRAVELRHPHAGEPFGGNAERSETALLHLRSCRRSASSTVRSSPSDLSGVGAGVRPGSALRGEGVGRSFGSTRDILGLLGGTPARVAPVGGGDRWDSWDEWDAWNEWDAWDEWDP